jgi:hypothetical protein
MFPADFLQQIPEHRLIFNEDDLHGRDGKIVVEAMQGHEFKHLLEISLIIGMDHSSGVKAILGAAGGCNIF